MKNTQKKKMSRSQAMRLKKSRQNKILSKGSIIIILVLFACCMGVLAQRLMISKLDQQVKKLNTEVEVIRSENDAKQGQLTESQNDTEIKQTARSYGMVEATSSQKVVETVTEQSVNDSSVEENNWIHRLFK